MANRHGKVISITSTKGGVGKTTLTLNLAGIYHKMGLKVLIIDLDLYSGGIALSLDIKNKKDIFMMIDSLNNNRFTSLDDYVHPYNENIDVISAPIDPRQATKIDSKYIPTIIDHARRNYDIVLVDTNHILDEVNITALDLSYMMLFVITNDPIDLKNTKNIIAILKDTGKINYRILLNNSRDTGKDYLSIFDIKNIIKNDIKYIISKNFYIRHIDKYVLAGDILTLNSGIMRKHYKDINVIKKLAKDLIEEGVAMNGK